jgi:hypothetical protein
MALMNEERIAQLEQKLALRRNKPGFSENAMRLERAVGLLKRRNVPLEQRIAEKEQ